MIYFRQLFVFVLTVITVTVTPLFAESLSNITFTAFDVETTGLNPKTGRIIEIAAVKFENGVIKDKKKWMINPNVPIPSASTAVHNITDDMVKKSPVFNQVFHEFTNFVGNTVLIAHNANFDSAFMNEEAKRNSLTMPPFVILDSLRLARKLVTETDKKSLEALTDFFDIKMDIKHRAMADTIALVEVFNVLLKKLPDDTTFTQLQIMCDITNRFGANLENEQND